MSPSCEKEKFSFGIRAIILKKHSREMRTAASLPSAMMSYKEKWVFAMYLLEYTQQRMPILSKVTAGKLPTPPGNILALILVFA
jgi:hypothetical protein